MSRKRTEPKVDKSGRKYGKLIVLKFSHYKQEKSGSQRAFWECECECGNTTVVNNSNLVSGNCRSCGCLHQERLKRLHESNIKQDVAFQAIIRDYKRGAKQRGFDFLLTKDQFRQLTKQNCFYCGIEPQRIKDRNGQHVFKNSVYVYNGIDRIDNNVGYVFENCVTCCTECNWAKGTKTQKEFLRWIERMIQYQRST